MLVVNRYGRKNAYFIHPSSLVPFRSFFGENKSKERGEKFLFPEILPAQRYEEKIFIFELRSYRQEIFLSRKKKN